MSSSSAPTRSRKRTTLADVARHCGVSVTTVSGILRGKDYCFASEETRRRVFEAADALHYQANVMAQSLRGERTRLVGVLMSSLISAARVAVEKIGTLEAAMHERGYRMLLRSHGHDSDREIAAVRECMGMNVDGLVLAASRGPGFELVARLRAEGLPCVLMDLEYEGLPTVAVDRRLGGYLQVQHLLAIGRRRLAFVLTGTKGKQGQAKIQGYRDALAEAGLSLEAFPVVEQVKTRNGYQAGVTLVQELIGQDRPFDALVTMGDSVAVGVIQALQASGRRVPEDVAVIGFDDEDYAAYASVPLSTIRQPREVGRLAFDLLEKQIEAGDPGVVAATVRQRVEPTLIVRTSTAGAGGPAASGAGAVGETRR